MKTAISLPEHLYKDAEKTAKSLGIPRSQLFAKALEEYISKYKRGEVTEKLNEIYGKMETGTGANIADIETASVESLRELTKNDAW
ncbi:MAG: ChpI protein [Rectinemataceae bacterium]|nr:ChpI protein [Rectinemataceae bacterium]